MKIMECRLWNARIAYGLRVVAYDVQRPLESKFIDRPFVILTSRAETVGKTNPLAINIHFLKTIGNNRRIAKTRYIEQTLEESVAGLDAEFPAITAMHDTPIRREATGNLPAFGLLGECTVALEVPETEVQDIDNETDWLIAEMKYLRMVGR